MQFDTPLEVTQTVNQITAMIVKVITSKTTKFTEVLTEVGNENQKTS